MGILVTLFFLYWVYYLVSQFRRRGEFTSNSFRDGTVDYCIKCGDFHPLHRRCNPISKFLNDREMNFNFKKTLNEELMTNKWIKGGLGALAVALILMLASENKETPETYETTTTTEVVEEKEYSIVTNFNNYIYGEIVRDILDAANIPAYEPAVKELSFALSRYIIRDIMTSYKFDKSLLKYNELYYDTTDEGRDYRIEFSNKFIKYEDPCPSISKH